LTAEVKALSMAESPEMSEVRNETETSEPVVFWTLESVSTMQ
jgi:hypothetical protein